MSVEKKLDEVIKNQGVIIQMLTDIIESIPDPKDRPDIRAILKPITDNPMIKNNPALSQMLDSFNNSVGGKS